ncbi:MAG: oligosaccharide flippase family protein [Bacteroidetes bacterium]|nr:oligosaccharide flippase family protein [Bacteroidota bacterium]
MQKKFITNLALLLFLNLLIKPFWILGIDRSVQNAVSPEIFGTYYALFNFTFLLNILLDLGITNFNNKNIAQNNHLLTKHVSSILSLRLLLGLVYTVITLSVGLIIGYSFGQLYVLFLLGFNQFLISFILYLRSNIAGLHLFKTDSIISVLDRLIMITICAILLWGHVTSSPFQIEWYVYAQTSAYLLTAIITMVIVIKKSQLKRLNWSKAFFLVILKKSYPYAILVLLMAFSNRIDTVMLERLLVDGAEQSAIYASAYRLLDSANMIAYLFAGLLLPIFARMIKLKHDLDELVKLAFSLLVTLSVIVALGSFFYSKELMGLMYTQHVEESARVFGYLMTCFVAISTTYVFGTLLTANGNMKELNTMASIGMFLNITLNLILIPQYKATGSAISSLVTQFSTAFFQVLIAQKVFKFKVNYRFLITLVLFICGVIVICFISKSLPNLAWMSQFMIMISLSFLWAFVIRIISVRSMYRIIKYE